MPEDILIYLGARRAELENAIQRYLAERDAIDSYIASHRKLDELKLFERLDLKFGSAEPTPGPEQAKTPIRALCSAARKSLNSGGRCPSTNYTSASLTAVS